MNTANAFRRLGAITLLGLGGLGAMPLAAQTPAPAQMQRGVLEEIVVTAQKREQTLREVAASIQAVSGDTIQDLNILRFEDLEQVTSGLQLFRQNQRNVTISNRGVYYDPEAGNPATVDVYQNGIVQRADNIFGALYDIERVEVLRGPQGSLQGATSPAGAIILNTVKPSLDEVEGYVQAAAHDMGLNVQGALSFPLLPGKIGLRLAAYDDQNDLNGITNMRTGREQDAETTSYRVSLQMLLAERITINLSYQNNDQFLYGTPQLVGTRAAIARPAELALYAADPRVVPQLPCSAVQIPDALADRRGGHGCPLTLARDDDAAYAAVDMSGENESQLYTLSAEMDIGDNHSLTYLLGYTDSVKPARTENDLASSLELQNLYYASTVLRDAAMEERLDTEYQTHQTTSTAVDTWTHELRLASQGRPFWNYMFGLYYNDQETTTDFRTFSLGARYIGLPTRLLNSPLNPVTFPDMSDDMFVMEGMNLILGGEIPVNREDRAFFTAHSFQLTETMKLEVSLRWQETKGFRTNDILPEGADGEEVKRILRENPDDPETPAVDEFVDALTAYYLGLLPGVGYHDEDSISAYFADLAGNGIAGTVPTGAPAPFDSIDWTLALSEMQQTELLEGLRLGTLANTKANTLARSTIIGAIPEAHQNPEDDAITGTISFLWDITDTLTGFAAYNRSNRVGGISINPGESPDLLPDQLYNSETSDSLEFGVRSLIGNRAEINAVLYYQVFDDYQGFVRNLFYLAPSATTGQLALDPLGGGLVFNGDMTSLGVDMDWRMLVSDSLTLGGTFNYNQSEFDNASLPCNPEGEDTLSQISQYEPGEILLYCESSGRIPGSPELQASIFVEFAFDFPFGQIFVRGNTKYSGGILATSAFESGTTPRETDAYTLANLFIGLRDPEATWEASLYINNLLDERADIDLRNPGSSPGTSGNFDPGGDFTEIIRLPPRSYGLRFRYNF